MHKGGYIEKRKTERYEMTSSIQYALHARTYNEVHNGVLVNISTTGMSAYMFSPHVEGQEIFITSRLPVNSQSAVIAWIREEDDGFYRVGLKFADQSS